MGMTSIDASMISKCFLSGAKTIEKNKEFINELNVFPVPDGDTGTNMTATIMAAAKEVVAASESDMAAVCKAMSSGSLRGARGNSGVILSQLLRGFTKTLKTEKSLDVKILASALQNACDTAYKAVMKPMEGTILTVARGAAEKARSLAESTDDIVFFVEEIVKEAEEVLKKTP
jgi:dihydroxyacetone kinase-like predicted kinase